MPQRLSIEEKIDNVLKTANNISSKLGHLEQKFTGLDKQLKEIDAKFSKRCTDLEENFKELELDAKFIGNRTSDLELSTTANLNDLKKQIKMNQEMNQGLSMRIRRLEKGEVMRESYSKRPNILVHGLKELVNDETKEQAKALFGNFLSEASEITLDSTKIVDLHRLPQQTIRKAGKAINRPIIVKLLTKFDKDKIFKNINRLKQYNDERKSRIFITDHLPKLFYNPKKQLMPEYEDAKEDGHSVR